MPVESAVLLPAEDGPLQIALQSTPTSASWAGMLAGDGDGLGTLTIDNSLLGLLTAVGDPLILTAGANGEIYLD